MANNESKLVYKKELNVRHEPDVLVVGGGPAGVAAALAAETENVEPKPPLASENAKGKLALVANGKNPIPIVVFQNSPPTPSSNPVGYVNPMQWI